MKTSISKLDAPDGEARINRANGPSVPASPSSGSVAQSSKVASSAASCLLVPTALLISIMSFPAVIKE